MTDPILAARALVLHDLAARGHVDAASVSLVEDVLTARRWWVEQWPEGGDSVAGQVAQDVQDHMLEQRARWPMCTACEPTTPLHELHITPELGPGARWVCEKSGSEIAPLGALPPP